MTDDPQAQPAPDPTPAAAAPVEAPPAPVQENPAPAPVVEPQVPVERVAAAPFVSIPVEPTPVDPTPTTPEPVSTAPQSSLAAESEIAAQRPVTVSPGVVDGTVYRPRSDDDVLSGHFCNVVTGPHAPRYGVFTNTASVGEDGYPDEVVVRTRDAIDENLIVKYSDIRPALAGGR